jgi:quercetin dioxygenase-like cupin family protein
MLKKSVLIIAALALVAAAAPLSAQTGLKRTVMQKFDVPPGERETVTAVVEIAPNTDVARHTHPGPETSYIVDGELTLNVEGQPTKVLKTGDAFTVPAGTIHAGRSGASGVKLFGVYIVEKGKPLATPAP